MGEPTAPRSRHPLRPLLACGGLAVAATAALLPVASHRLGPTTSFVPFMLGTVACFDLLSVLLLLGEAIDTGERRSLAMAQAYVASLVLMTGYALAFPGVIPTPPLASSPSVAPWLYIGWHAGFPVLLGLAWAPWPHRARRPAPATRRRRDALLATGATVLGASAVVAAVTLAGRRLPVLIHGTDTARMTALTAPLVLPLVAAALACTAQAARHRTGPERWSAVAVLVCLCDLVLTYGSRYRYSVGWYAGRGLTLVGAAVVLVAMLGDFRRLRAASVRDAGTDSLTGLANRRALLGALGAELAWSRRGGRSTCLLLADLDGFKAVNDEQGHDAGDRLLVAVGRAWSGLLREGDLLARIGGDEFAVLLPDASPAHARAVASRLAEVTPAAVGVSIGVASTDDLTPSADGTGADADRVLMAADAAMYLVKRGHHEQVAVPAPRTGRTARATVG